MAKTRSRTSRKAKPPVARGARRSAAQRSKKPPSRAPARQRPAASPRNGGTKQAQVLAMLRSTGGATIAALMDATGWQQHSVRGFLAGVVRKRLKLDLVSDQTDKGRVYRIRDKRSGTGSAAKAAI